MKLANNKHVFPERIRLRTMLILHIVSVAFFILFVFCMQKIIINNMVLTELKYGYSSSWKSPHRYEKSHAMGSHSVTCHPVVVTFPPLPPAEAGTRFSDAGEMQG